MPPSAGQIALVRAAVSACSSQVIRDAAIDLRLHHFPVNQWLALNNRYANNTIGHIQADVAAKRPPRTVELTRYVAASVFVHCFDGWAFLGNAVGSLLDGDVGAAVHLAYYAELRAVMSFLASEGFAVFNTHHYWFDAAGVCNRLSGPGTHDTVWHALQEWAGVPNKGATLLNLFSVAGRPIVDWLNAGGHVFGAAALAALASEWLRAWSLDLLILGKDHVLRNESSYRPQGINGRRQRRHLIETLEAIGDYWRACEPAGVDRFQLLDLHLLRLAIERRYRSQTTQAPRGAGYTAFLKGIAANLALPWNSAVMRFLMRATVRTNHPLFLYAMQRAQVSNSSSFRPLPMVARAILLLRVASAACERIIQYSAIASPHLTFYWDQLGDDIGLWPTGNQPIDPIELWDDIPPALDAVDAWRNGAPNPCNIHDARLVVPGDLWTLKQFNRVAIWGVGL
jgi:hypothetical protein